MTAPEGPRLVPVEAWASLVRDLEDAKELSGTRLAREIYDAVLTRIAMLAAAPSEPAIESRVKALEWENSGLGIHYARTAFGRYRASPSIWWFENVVARSCEGGLEATKAAAQADYESRILSAVASEPAGEAETPAEWKAFEAEVDRLARMMGMRYKLDPSRLPRSAPSPSPPVATEALRAALTDALIWHESEDKALSKQPPQSDNQWRRLQHQEQASNIRAALADGGAT